MNILDESTKAMLDAGKVAVLDKYLIMTPETLFQTVQGATLETLSGITGELSAEEQANSSSMNQGAKCHFCGKESDYGTEYIMTIEGGYNSDHDMEVVSMDVCAGCLEKMLAAVS